MRDLTITELQAQLPCGDNYSTEFHANPQEHKDFAHALTHIFKAAGKLAAEVEVLDHGLPFAPEVVTKMLADLVICTMRMANKRPGGAVDLQRAVEDRLESKNDLKLLR